MTGQDISGPTTFRVAATRPELVRSYGAIETGLSGFGLEMLADVTHGGAWHIGFLAAPVIPEMLLTGRERAFLEEYAFPALCGTPDTFTGDDIDEFARSYARTGAFAGASGLYRSMLTEGDEIRALATRKLGMPVLAVGGGSGEFTSATVRQVAMDVSAVLLEAPDRLADALMSFCKEVDSVE